MRLSPPLTASGWILLVSWAAVILYWLAMAGRVKRSIERAPGWPRFLMTVVVIIILVAWGELSRRGLVSDQRLWPRSIAITVIGEVLAVGGAMFAIWARTTLGANWSASVTYKQGHELIVRGPYRVVRHPIYTGLLLLLIGTTLIIGTPGWVAALAGGFLVMVGKLRMEERLMVQHFPEEYSEYRGRVRGLIPFVW